MIWTKAADQSAKLQTVDCSRKSSYFMTLKIDAKFEEKWICCFRNDKNFVKFDPSTQKSPKTALLFAPVVEII